MASTGEVINILVRCSHYYIFLFLINDKIGVKYVQPSGESLVGASLMLLV